MITHIGSQIREVRKRQGRSARSVALAAGIKYDHYLDFELDRHPYPRPHTLAAIEQVLGVRVVVRVVDVEAETFKAPYPTKE